jgi:hypothetical protein
MGVSPKKQKRSPSDPRGWMLPMGVGWLDPKSERGRLSGVIPPLGGVGQAVVYHPAARCLPAVLSEL